MVVLHGFICLLVAYGVIVTAQKVWLVSLCIPICACSD